MRFLERLAQHARSQGEHAAIVKENFTVSYHDLFQCVNRSRLALQASDFTASDVVGITLDDEVENLIVSLALMAIGAAQITLASHDTEQLRISVAERAGVTKIVSGFDPAWLKPESCPGDRRIAAARERLLCISGLREQLATATLFRCQSIRLRFKRDEMPTMRPSG